MKIHYNTTVVIITFLSLFSFIKTDSVCDLNMLLTEINQDLADNGMLDCLRVIDPPHFVEETEDQKNLRLAAQWDTPCAFEAETNWKDLISKNYGINQLVDSIGDPVAKDFDNQADMCEIVRAAVAKNIFKIRDLNLQSIPIGIINKIDCVGTVDKKGVRICAATGTSYYQKDSWSIFLNPSYIKFASKPKFVKEKKRAFEKRNDEQPTDSLLKTLLKMGKKNLVNNEAKIAGMIDNEVSDNQEPEHQKEKSKVVHVHVKRIATSSIKSTGDFSLLQGGNMSFKLEESRLIFAFSMMSFKLKTLGKISTKFSFNGREVAETRQNLGLIKDGSLTAAFAEVYNPNGKDLELNILCDSKSDGEINSSLHDHNLSFGVITMPVGAVFKHNNARTLNFVKTENWISLNSFDLSINFTGKKEAYFMILYNFGMKLGGEKGSLHTRLNVDAKPIKASSITSGPLEAVGNHAANVIKLNPGKHMVKVDYKFEAEEDLQINDFTDAHYTQSMVAFQLPENTIVNNYVLDKSVSLNTGGGFKPFGMNASVNLETNKTVLIIFNVNMKADGGSFTVRLRMGNKFNRKSVISVKDLSYGRAFGYVVRVLKKGTYTFDLDFNSDSKSTFNPGTADSSVASLQIIEMD